MATNTLNVRMKQAVRTEAEWTSDNPVLLEGEVAYSSDKNNKYKIGDGASTWDALSYNLSYDRGIEYIRGTWTTASGTWTGVSKDYELYDGKQIILYMPFAGSGNATLNLTLADGTTTGAKNVYYESTTRFTTHKGQNSQLHLIYHEAQKLSDGNTYSGWWYIANRDTTDIYKLGDTYVSWKTKAALYRYMILLTYDEEYLLPVNSVNNSQDTTKTLTTEEFDPFGQIYYYNSTTTRDADAKLNDWQQIHAHWNNGLIDLRYAFNTGKTLVANKPIYLVCVPQSNGKVKLYSNPIAQDLPTTADGLIYKYLGRAYDTYRITLEVHKPNYIFRNGGVQEYVRDAITVNGHTINSDVPSNAVFTDTVTTATTTGNGNAVTAITASNGALTVTKGTTFLTSHQDISGKADKSATVSNVAWDSTNKKLTKTINGTTSDVVTAATLRTAINVADGAEVNQNAFSNVTIGSTTISADSKTDTLTLVAGSNITLTPDATNDKITIAATDTNTDTKVTNTLNTTAKAYLTGTTSATTSTGTQVFDTGIYSTTTAGQLNATTYKVNEKVTLQYDSTNECLNFVFN